MHWWGAEERYNQLLNLLLASCMKNCAAPDSSYGSRKDHMIHYPSDLSLDASISTKQTCFDVKEHLCTSTCPKKAGSPQAAHRENCLSGGFKGILYCCSSGII